MAQTRKRRRKHRGTQAGTVEARGRTSRPREGAKKTAAPKSAKERRAERLNKPPTWRGSINRAAIAAVLFGIFVTVAGKGGNPVQGVVLAIVVFLFYLPLTYYLDRFMYRRRQQKQRGG